MTDQVMKLLIKIKARDYQGKIPHNLKNIEPIKFQKNLELNLVKVWQNPILLLTLNC